MGSRFVRTLDSGSEHRLCRKNGTYNQNFEYTGMYSENGLLIGSYMILKLRQFLFSIQQSRWALICVLCRERVGACIQCSVKTCKTAYHVTCAFKHGLEMRAIIDEENSSDDDNTVKLRVSIFNNIINSFTLRVRFGLFRLLTNLKWRHLMPQYWKGHADDNVGKLKREENNANLQILLSLFECFSHIVKSIALIAKKKQSPQVQTKRWKRSSVKTWRLKKKLTPVLWSKCNFSIDVQIVLTL